ncbi:MAG: hypothetical protein ACM3U1_00790 [Chloroflexota bacterium]
MEKIYKNNRGADVAKRSDSQGRDRTSKHVSISKTVTRDSSNRIIITLTMTKTITMQRVLPYGKA